MTETSKIAIKAIIESDATITPKDKTRILNAIEGQETIAPLLTRNEVAKLIHKTPVLVDLYARKGFLKRIYLGNSTRAAGFDAESVKAFVAGKSATAERSAE